MQSVKQFDMDISIHVVANRRELVFSTLSYRYHRVLGKLLALLNRF